MGLAMSIVVPAAPRKVKGRRQKPESNDIRRGRFIRQLYGLPPVLAHNASSLPVVLQKSYFTANCMMRGSPDDVMRPKVAAENAVFGLSSRNQLNALNASTRASR